MEMNACRFCGKFGQEEETVHHVDHLAGWRVICHPCGATGPVKPTADEAVAAWNGDLSNAMGDVFAERRRQVDKEGYAPEHDDEHATGELAGAAACYALWDIKHWAARLQLKYFWPWSLNAWKPADPRRNLVRASALIVAEIERLDRAEERVTSSTA